MTIHTTANNILSRMQSLTEVTGQDDEGEDITANVLDTVVVGDYDTNQMPPGKALSIRAVLEDDTLDYAGPNPTPTPFTVPWHLTLYVTGQISQATLEVYRIVPLIKASILTDMTFSGACSEAYWAKPNTIYDEITRNKSQMTSGARIIFMTTYY